MSLGVLNVAYPFAPVGARGVGGAEQILTDLDRSLVRQGHRSFVVACERSETVGELFPIRVPTDRVLDEEKQRSIRFAVQKAIDQSIATQGIDLVHMHGIDFYCYEIPADVPVLVTLHLPIAWYPSGIWWRLKDRARFCCVSNSQKASCPPAIAHCEVIENGVDLPDFDPAHRKEEFALVLGRVCPEKNAHIALEAGNLSGTPVLIGGHVYPYLEHVNYFQNCVEPLIQASRHPAKHRFLGVLEPEHRLQLLRRAKCLLHPTLAPETSSLVAMEALAAGTPVIAYPSGELASIVENGVTGFLVQSAEEMAQAIRMAPRISPHTCRERALERFSKQRMVDRYMDLYRKLAHSTRMEFVHV